MFQEQLTDIPEPIRKEILKMSDELQLNERQVSKAHIDQKVKATN